MKFTVNLRIALCAVVASLISGCVNPVQIKNVQEDKAGYLTDHFSPDNLPGPVRKTISEADGGQLNFKRIVYRQTWTLNVDDKNKTTTMDEATTLTNAGGGFVEFLSENSRNGVPMSQMYKLSYRNLVPLKSQTMNLSARVAPLLMEVKNFKHFDPITSLRNGLEYEFQYGTSVQIMNFRDGRTSCVRGDAKPATDVYASLSGEAWDVVCTEYNMNGVPQGKRRYVYLDKYGVAISVHSELSTGVSDAKITSIIIE